MENQCLGFLIKNFPNEITWYQVKIVCSKLEDGWRIPTNNELKQILNKTDTAISITKEMCFVGAFWSSNIFNLNQSWKFTIRKWKECAPGYSTYANSLLVVKNV